MSKFKNVIFLILLFVLVGAMWSVMNMTAEVDKYGYSDLGKDINADHIQLKNGNGYDHNFCIKDANGELVTAASALGDKSGIKMEVKTTLPGIQFYTGNFLDGTVLGKENKPMTHRSAFCFETQVFPDSPNHPLWPKCIYDAGEEYKSQTVFSFSV